MRRRAIAAASLLALTLAAPAAASSGGISVLVLPRFSPADYAPRGAVGLFVPGAGERVSREAAIAALLRGRVENSVTGGIPGGKKLVSLGTKPAAVTIYVALPPPGWHANERRYPIAIVGDGYHGLLTSGSTRIAGLVAIADVAPTVRALRQGSRPAIRSRPDANAPAALASLDRRIDRAQDARLGSTLILALAVLVATLAAFAFRSCYVARVAVLAAPAALAASLVVSAADVIDSGPVVALLAALTAAGSLLGALRSDLLPFLLLAVVAGYLLTFAGFPDVSSLAAIGAHVDGGGRFYGATNLTETILVAVSLLAAGLLGPRWLVPVAALTLVTIGWSRAGADGGGLVVLVAGFLTLALVQARTRLAPRALGVAAAGAVALVLALVGLDAATGGSSHVTRAAGRGPGGLADDLGHRIHISAASFVSSWHAALVIVVSLAALVLLALRPPRSGVGVALLVAIAVSLVVNDSPADVAAAGALSYGAIWVYERRCHPAYLRPVRQNTVASDS